MSASVTKSVTRSVTKKPRRSDFYKLRYRLCLDIEAAAELCGVTTRTIQNWDTKGAPAVAMRLLVLYDRVDLSGQGNDWKGWRFSRGRLICGALAFTPQHLRQAQLYAESFTRLELARLRLADGLPVADVLQIALG